MTWESISDKTTHVSCLCLSRVHKQRPEHVAGDEENMRRRKEGKKGGTRTIATQEEAEMGKHIETCDIDDLFMSLFASCSLVYAFLSVRTVGREGSWCNYVNLLTTSLGWPVTDRMALPEVIGRRITKQRARGRLSPELDWTQLNYSQRIVTSQVRRDDVQ